MFQMGLTGQRQAGGGCDARNGNNSELLQIIFGILWNMTTSSTTALFTVVEEAVLGAT